MLRTTEHCQARRRVVSAPAPHNNGTHLVSFLALPCAFMILYTREYTVWSVSLTGSVVPVFALCTRRAPWRACSAEWHVSSHFGPCEHEQYDHHKLLLVHCKPADNLQTCQTANNPSLCPVVQRAQQRNNVRLTRFTFQPFISSSRNLATSCGSHGRIDRPLAFSHSCARKAGHSFGSLGHALGTWHAGWLGCMVKPLPLPRQEQSPPGRSSRYRRCCWCPRG